MDFGNMPDWVPFACLATNRVVRKPMIARVLEGLTIAAIGVVSALFVGLPVAMERIDSKIQVTASSLAAHEVWAKVQLEKRDREIMAVAAAAERRDIEIKRTLENIEKCLRERVCGK